MANFIHDLEASLHKGFIDRQNREYQNYKPRLLVNRQSENVLTSILEELQNCKSFMFLVAFITESGLATLKAQLLDLKHKGISGRIITSTFLKFNQPKVFRELLKISNVEVKVTSLEGFHSKGYVFNNDTYYSLIVGSSNLTAHALKVNFEVNLKVTSHENGELVHHFNSQFEELWQNSQPLSEHWIQEYEILYNQQHKDQQQNLVTDLPSSQTNALAEALQISPNKMQQIALQQIQSLRDEGKNKGLIISATGTGKTYLSAFDVRRFSPKRMLFVVHREQILQKAKSDYYKVLGGAKSDYGILSGTIKQSHARYLFATIQMLSKDEVLRDFDPKEFDYILIDEVHKAGAASYVKVINYFTPKFLMGMTATPERTDDFNIYELFDYNIAYEIRLQEALEEDMLCPFHYFGVTDIEYNGEIIDDTTMLDKLVTEERVQHVIEKIEYYGYSGEQVRGLMFVSRKTEAEELSVALNNRGYRTVALTGDHSQEERIHQVDQLENGSLDYIITVDIFNEGIDIPSVNQVVMLRQTESSIIFIQQLGRGLRKHGSKEFVTIIDFIGNYKNNYMIPLALSGDKSQNKDNIRRNMSDTSYIRGISSVNFEEVAKKLIFRAINNSNLTALKRLREAYKELKNRIGRMPYLVDFIKHDSIDPVVLANEYSNYQQFLLKIKEDVPALTDYENQVLNMVSCEVLNGKRMHEALLLDLLLERGMVRYNEYVECLAAHNCRTDEDTLSSVNRVFDLSFFTQLVKPKYGGQPICILREDKTYEFGELVQRSLQSSRHFKKMLRDVVDVALAKSKAYRHDQPLTLYQKYTRKDVCKLLNWKSDESATLFGYKTKFGICPIFITYHKHEGIDESVAYEEEFVNRDILKWSTRGKRTIESKEVQTIINAQENNIELHIFVKKDDDEGKEYYYLGQAVPDMASVQQGTMRNGKPVVHMNLILEQSVDTKLYYYLTSVLNV